MRISALYAIQRSIWIQSTKSISSCHLSSWRCIQLGPGCTIKSNQVMSLISAWARNITHIIANNNCQVLSLANCCWLLRVQSNLCFFQAVEYTYQLINHYEVTRFYIYNNPKKKKTYASESLQSHWPILIAQTQQESVSTNIFESKNSLFHCIKKI